MQKQGVFTASAFVTLLTLCLLPGIAHAANVTVGCPGGNGGTYTSINAALASLDPSADNTIIGSGSCTENAGIVGFSHLTLIGLPGASITDNSGGTDSPIHITNSPYVSVQNFTINGSGPNDQGDGIDCVASNCFFSGNTVQHASDGVDVLQGAHASFNGDVLQDNNFGGIVVLSGSNAFANGVTLQRNAEEGVLIGASFFQMNNSTVQNNPTGVLVTLNGTANIFHTTITGNGGDGIDVVSHSTFRLGRAGDAGSSITGNHGVGILVKDLSFALFTQGVPNVVKNNLGRTDVLCSPKFPVTRGALTNIGGGRTNCEEDNNQ